MKKQTRFRTCNLCEALCGLEIEVQDNEVISIKGDSADVFSQGHICPKAVALKDIHEDPDRLKVPLRRTKNGWEEMKWEEAIDEVARRIVNIQHRYGDHAIGIYQGNPSIHNLGTSLFSPIFVRTLNTTNRFSATSVDQLGHHLAGEYMFGHMNLMPVPDIDRTDFWLILGGNPLVSNGSIMTAPNVGKRLRDIQKRGGQVVVVDPRRTETAAKADRFLSIRPGTDIYLLLALIKRTLDSGSVNLRHLQKMVDPRQIDEVKNALNNLTYQHISVSTGIPESDLLWLADAYLAADRAVCYGRLGVSAVMNGGLNHWAINFLNIISGNFDRPGGAMLPDPAIPVASHKSRRKRFGRWHSRIRQLPETGGELPAAVMAEEILTPGEGQIKAMITSCGNPILSTPNGQQLDKAFDSLDFMVSIDIYLNESSRHADMILPPATGLETPHYSMAFHNLAIRNTAKYSSAAVEKDPRARYDWEIYQMLTRAILKARGLEGNDQIMTPESMLQQGLQSGRSGLTFEDLVKHPHGIDLGPLDAVIKDKLLNEDGLVDLFPAIYRQALHDVIHEQPRRDQMLLIGRRHLRSNNSWLHNSYRMVKGPKRCTALIHPDDAKRLGIENGQDIEVTSRVGSVTIEAEINDDIRQGVLSIPHGWGHHREHMRMHVAETHAGISVNDLVDDQVVDPLTGVAVINGIPVDITAVTAQ